MLGLQKIFPIVMFFNLISGDKSLKAKISLSYVFFLFNSPEAAEEIQKPASMELHE